MKLETAIKQINKEAAFIGWSGPAIIQDIAKHGRMLYSERTMEAYRVIQDKFPLKDSVK
jgi:hypothetical protein